MLTNHFKITLRQVTRNKTFSFVNLTGLIAGITVCLFVAQFVWFEWSFERFNVNADRTYRINLYNTSNGVFDNISSATVSGLAYAMKQTVPGLESISRLSSPTKAVVTNKERAVENLESRIVFADPSIVSMLGIDLIHGDGFTVLRKPQSIIISKAIAMKYFGDVNATGKSLEMGFAGDSEVAKSFLVEGVFNDIPANTHQHFDFIVAPENEQAWNENWAWSNVSTYARLGHGISSQSLEAGMAQIVKQHHQDNTGDKYLLEPITDIRLHALDGTGRGMLVNFFIIIGGVILVLAWFNYVSLSTARFLERMKEVAIRKLVGASRKQLVLQLLTESFFYNFISFSCALVLFVVTWPFLAHYLQLPTSELLLDEPSVFIVIPMMIVIATICSGFYPSLFLSSFKPLQSVKGKLNELTDRSTLREVLVIVQLSIAVILITSILAIYRQLNFMRSQDIGMAIDQTLIIEEPLLHDATTIQKFEPFKNEILRLPSVTGVTYASTFAGSEIDWHRTDITVGNQSADHHYDSRIIGIGTEFLEVFNLSILSGRNFNPNNEGDRQTMLINEKAYNMFGFKTFEEALGKAVFIGSREFEIIGVVRNYHVRSFQYEMQPILFIQGYPRNPSYAIKIQTENIAETVSTIESKWKEAYHGNVFRYYFLEDQFDQQYSSERQMATIISGLTFLAILISFLGLFGLALFTVNRRTKEIGIRKVLGASVTNVVILLSREFVQLVIIGAVVAVPIVYQGSKIWLEQYAYQMPIDISLFVLPVGIVLLLTLITISFQTMTAAKTNPVDTLKCE